MGAVVNTNRITGARLPRLVVALGATISLSGCLALPPALQVASLAIDGFSYMSTGKSMSDHAISAITKKDCAVLRALDDVDGICVENGIETASIDMDVAGGIYDTPVSADMMAANDDPYHLSWPDEAWVYPEGAGGKGPILVLDAE